MAVVAADQGCQKAGWEVLMVQALRGNGAHLLLPRAADKESSLRRTQLRCQFRQVYKSANSRCVFRSQVLPMVVVVAARSRAMDRAALGAKAQTAMLARRVGFGSGY
jgi:hypothetical protein